MMRKQPRFELRVVLRAVSGSADPDRAAVLHGGQRTRIAAGIQRDDLGKLAARQRDASLLDFVAVAAAVAEADPADEQRVIGSDRVEVKIRIVVVVHDQIRRIGAARDRMHETRALREVAGHHEPAHHELRILAVRLLRHVRIEDVVLFSRLYKQVVVSGDKSFDQLSRVAGRVVAGKLEVACAARRDRAGVVVRRDDLLRAGDVRGSGDTNQAPPFRDFGICDDVGFAAVCGLIAVKLRPFLQKYLDLVGAGADRCGRFLVVLARGVGTDKDRNIAAEIEFDIGRRRRESDKHVVFVRFGQVVILRRLADEFAALPAPRLHIRAERPSLVVL